MYTRQERELVDRLLAKGRLNQQESRLLIGTMRRAQERARTKQLAKAKEEAAESGKEAFSLDKLDTYYLPDEVYPSTETENRRAARAREYEWLYYCIYRHVHTLAGFGKKMNESDMYDGGDLGRDE